jgi:5-hydroxyisourate hydrolase-like protein (transthyretin family)
MGILAAAAFAEQTVEGHVVNSVTGAGIAGVTVDLHAAGEMWRTPVYSRTTDAEGRFRIEGVKDGAYSASYDARGYWHFPGIGMFDGIPPSFQVTSGGDPVHLESKLSPIGRIMGRVLDGADKPVPNASVVLRWESWACTLPLCVGFAPHATTNEKGEYSITDIEVRGAWLVSATAPVSWPPPKSLAGSGDDEPRGWAQTFYPGVADSQLAARFIVQPGRELILDIKLAPVPVHRIRGRVLDVRGDPMPKATVTLSQGRTFLSPRQENTKEDGTFEFESIADDEWRLTATVNQDGIKLWTAQEAHLNGRSLENVELRLAAPFSTNGKILVDVPQGVPAPNAPELMLDFHTGISQPGDPGGTSFSRNNPKGSGDFTIKNLYPGPYQILPPPPPYFIDSIRLGDREVAVDSDINILSGALPLYVTYKLNGGGTVRGTVRGKDDSCNGAHVVLIPQNPWLRRTGFIRHATCGPNGGFEIPAIPGEYYGLAIAGDSPTPWYAGILDDGLIKQAISITVRANETTSVEMRPITR